MKKIPSFTITDVIVTMIISMFVVGIAFSVFRISYNQLFHYSAMNDEYKELYQLYTLMQQDFQKAQEITYVNDEMQLLMDTQKMQHYELFDEMIVRRTSVKNDTFFVALQNVSVRFNNTEVNTGHIDEININIMKGETVLPYKFIKEYSTELRMNMEEQN